VLIAAKFAEMALMVLAYMALTGGPIEALVVILFLLSTQATFFSPAKYGILPELLAPAQLSRANGLMEMTRDVAVILRTPPGGLLCTIWHGQPARIGALLIAIAAAGMLASPLIGRGPRPSAARSFRINPWREIAEGLRRLSGDRSLAFAVAGIACFDFLCTLVTLDMILVVKGQMELDDLHVGMLGAAAGLGAGAGSIAAARLSGDRIEPCLAFAGYIGVGALLFGLAAASTAYIPTAIVFL